MSVMDMDVPCVPSPISPVATGASPVVPDPPPTPVAKRPQSPVTSDQPSQSLSDSPYTGPKSTSAPAPSPSSPTDTSSKSTPPPSSPPAPTATSPSPTSASSSSLPPSTSPSSTPTASPPPPPSSPNPTPSTAPAPGSPPPSAPAAQPAQPAQPPRPQSFAALAKRVMIQARMRRAAEEGDAEEAAEDEPEEDEPEEELETRAKAGDPKAQSHLGKYYLKLAEEQDEEENNRLAVGWLVQAAKQGRRDAPRLLQRCWIQRKGITPENEAEVRKLSAESKFEQAVRRAAMMMYWKLNPDRKEKVAVAEMLENVGEVHTGGGAGLLLTVRTQRKVLESMVASESGKSIDLDDFVEITKKYAQGISPTQETTDSGRVGERTLGKIPGGVASVDKEPAGRKRRTSWLMGSSDMMEKRALDIKSHFLVMQYPLHAIMEVKDQLIDWASRASVQWLSAAIPTHHVNALIFFFIISNLTIDLFAFTIPLLIFYLSFISMVICTLRVFQSSKGWENFRTLTAILIRFEPSLDVEQAESNFGWNNLEPYLYFMVSVFFVIFTFPVADKGWIPCSELSTVAMFFTALSYMSLSPSAAAYAKRALVIEVASSVCALTSRLPEKMAARMLSRTFATVPLGESVVLKLSLPCLLYIYLFYLFFSMARMRGFRGTYCFLVPYLVCFMWCEFSVILLQHSSGIGLIRTGVAYFLFLFALPVLAMGLAAMLFIQMVKWFLELELTKMLVTLAVCFVPVALRLWTRFGLSLGSVWHSVTHRGPVKLILCCVTTVIVLCGVYVYNAEGLSAYSTLTWQQYGRLCGPPAWQGRGMAQTQIFCSHMEGHRVSWTGTFRHVRVAATENGAQSVINLLPVFMGDWLRCLYGEAYPKCEPRNATAVANLTDGADAQRQLLHQQEEEELCKLKAVAKHQCHVKRFDSHSFEVTVGMPTTAVDPGEPTVDVVLLASHEFRQVLLNFDTGTTVEFSTKLEGRSLGSGRPVFELQAIHCLDCSSLLLPQGRQVKIRRNWRKTTLHAVKFAFDFFFSPFLSTTIDV